MTQSFLKLWFWRYPRTLYHENLLPFYILQALLLLCEICGSSLLLLLMSIVLVRCPVHTPVRTPMYGLPLNQSDQRIRSVF